MPLPINPPPITTTFLIAIWAEVEEKKFFLNDAIIQGSPSSPVLVIAILT